MRRKGGILGIRIMFVEVCDENVLEGKVERRKVIEEREMLSVA